MSDQSVRQQTRRAALEAPRSMRRERRAQERRLQALGVYAATALTQRDAAILRYETRAGEALRQMTQDEGLKLRDAARWAGGMSIREASRLRSRAVKAKGENPDGPLTDGSGAERGAFEAGALAPGSQSCSVEEKADPVVRNPPGPQREGSEAPTPLLAATPRGAELH